MEQLIAVFGIDWRELLAQTFNFVVLLGVLSYFLYTPVMKALDERTAKIAKGLADADAAAAARAATEAERSSVIKEAQHSAEMVAARAEEEGKRERAAIVKSAEARAEALIVEARAQAEESARSRLKQSEQEVARTAVLAAEKILRTHQ